jgi:hypothetical protein
MDILEIILFLVICLVVFSIFWTLIFVKHIPAMHEPPLLFVIHFKRDDERLHKVRRYGDCEAKFEIHRLRQVGSTVLFVEIYDGGKLIAIEKPEDIFNAETH